MCSPLDWRLCVQSERLLQSDAQATRRQLEVKLTRLQESRTDKEQYLQVGLGRDNSFAVTRCRRGWSSGLIFVRTCCRNMSCACWNMSGRKKL